MAVLALVAAACGGDDDAEDATGDGAEWTTCESPESGYRVDHPAGWETNTGDVMPPCSLFDPEPIDVPEQTEIPTEIAVAITVEPPAPASSGEDPAGSAEDDVLAEREEVVDGHPATRLEVASTGEGLYPAGLRTTRWVVDVDGGRIVARTHDTGDLAYGEKQDVLDAMMETLTVTDEVDEPGDGDDTTTSTTTGEAPADEGAEPVGEPAREPVESGGFPTAGGELALLTDVRVAAHDGFDRVVLELEGDDPPSYRVREVEPPIREDGSGREVDVEGDAYLEISMQPASGVDLRGDEPEQTYEGPDSLRLPEGSAVREVVKTGDFESHLTWVIGLDEPTPYAVTMLRDPLRLVVDVVPAAGD